MTHKNKTLLKAGILIPLALFAFFELTMISLVFSYLNQSSLTHKEDQLNFANYLLPYLLTVGFIFYYTYDQISFREKELKGISWIKIVSIGTAAIIAVPWQIKHIDWQLQKVIPQVTEITPYIIGTVFTIATIIAQLSRLKNKNTSI